MAIPSLGAMAGLIEFMPDIMFWSQIVFYIFLIFFFGSIVLKGYKGYLHGVIHLLLRIGTGFACLVAGIGLSSLLPFGDNLIFKMLQVDIIIGGLVASIVLLVCLYIITFKFSRTLVVKKKIEKLQERLSKTKDRPPSKRKVDPFIVVGVIIIILFLGLSLVNFRGFPSMSDELFSALGITPEEFSQMGSLLGSMEGTGGAGGLEDLLPEGMVIEGGKPLTQQSAECMSAMFSMVNIQSQLQDPEFLISHMYSNQAIAAMIESESNKKVSQMFRITEGGNDVIIAITEDMFSCIATPSELCTCAGQGS